MNHYTATYNSPLGPIVIESNGETLTGLRFGEGELGLRSGDFGVGTVPHPMPTHATSSLPIFDEVIRWLDDYFAGRQTENAVMLKKDALNQKNAARIIVQPKGTAFQQRVWQALLTIPYGKTASYGEIARWWVAVPHGRSGKPSEPTLSHCSFPATASSPHTAN